VRLVPAVSFSGAVDAVAVPAFKCRVAVGVVVPIPKFPLLSTNLSKSTQLLFCIQNQGVVLSYIIHILFAPASFCISIIWLSPACVTSKTNQGTVVEAHLI
jgi:hypothetical protein